MKETSLLNNKSQPDAKQLKLVLEHNFILKRLCLLL